MRAVRHLHVNECVRFQPRLPGGDERRASQIASISPIPEVNANSLSLSRSTDTNHPEQLAFASPCVPSKKPQRATRTPSSVRKRNYSSAPKARNRATTTKPRQYLRSPETPLSSPFWSLSPLIRGFPFLPSFIHPQYPFSSPLSLSSPFPLVIVCSLLLYHPFPFLSSLLPPFSLTCSPFRFFSHPYISLSPITLYTLALVFLSQSAFIFLRFLHVSLTLLSVYPVTTSCSSYVLFYFFLSLPCQIWRNFPSYSLYTPHLLSLYLEISLTRLCDPFLLVFLSLQPMAPFPFVLSLFLFPSSLYSVISPSRFLCLYLPPHFTFRCPVVLSL